MKQYVKFIGKFTDLIPQGWTFQKLFANNYRQYHKTCDGSEYAQGCSIWQHLGGYLEIADLSNLSVVVVKQIADGKIKEWESQTTNIFDGKPDFVYWFRIDTENKIFYPYHSLEYKKILREQWSLMDLPDGEEKKKKHRAFYDKYREFNMRSELITMIQDLLDKKQIMVCDDDRKERYKL